MKQLFLKATFISICLCACTPITELPQLPQPTLKSRISSRTSSNGSLPDGATALFNINGSIQLTDHVFTYNGDNWRSNDGFQWEKQEGTVFLTAIHPVLDTYNSNHLYPNEQLCDILIAKDTVTTDNDIHITFKHLFASLTITANDVLQENLQEIRLTVPQSISFLTPADGSYTTISQSHTTCIPYDGSDSYRFIIPPMEKAILSLQLIMANETIYTHSLSPHTFQSGYQYECNIIQEEQRPGIRNAEDLIAFSLLINKQDYTGEKSLTDFGEEIEGRMVYQLLSDITFTEEESQRFLPISFYEARAFQDIFDGNHHSISQLTLPDKSTNSKVHASYSGLFGYIGTNGIVRNLTVRHARSTPNATCIRTGFIAAYNEGSIMNCGVEHSIAHEGKHERTGFICGQMSSQGFILNSYASNDTITSETSAYVGGIVGYANGHVLNCYSSSNYYNLNPEYLSAGGIVGYSPTSYPLVIANCLTYNTEKEECYKAAIETAKKVTISNFFYNLGILYNSTNSSNVTQENIYIYDQTFQTEGTDITLLLNNWIANTGNDTYPNSTFRRWAIKEKRIAFE